MDLFTQKESDHIYLVSRGAKGEIRCFELWYEETSNSFIIHRQSSQYQGKIVDQPDIEITEETILIIFIIIS